MIIPIVYSLPMDPLVVVSVSPLNKKEDPAVETWALSIKNNVILPVNVDTLTVIILCLELAKDEPIINIQIKISIPIALPQMTAMELQTTVCSPPMDHMIMDVAFLGNKKEDPVVETLI